MPDKRRIDRTLLLHCPTYTADRDKLSLFLRSIPLPLTLPVLLAEELSHTVVTNKTAESLRRTRQILQHIANLSSSDMHNTTTNHHLSPQGQDTNTVDDDENENMIVVILYIILCILLNVLLMMMMMTESDSVQLTIIFYYQLYYLLSDNTTVLQTVIYRNVLQPLNLVVADRFGGVGLFDDVHKSESKKKTKKNITLEFGFPNSYCTVNARITAQRGQAHLLISDWKLLISPCPTLI